MDLPAYRWHGESPSACISHLESSSDEHGWALLRSSGGAVRGRHGGSRALGPASVPHVIPHVLTQLGAVLGGAPRPAALETSPAGRTDLSWARAIHPGQPGLASALTARGARPSTLLPPYPAGGPAGGPAGCLQALLVFRVGGVASPAAGVALVEIVPRALPAAKAEAGRAEALGEGPARRTAATLAKGDSASRGGSARA